MQDMKLTYLSLSKNGSYENNPEGYTGQLRYSGTAGAVELQLDERTSARILEVIADELVESSRSIAQNLTNEALNSVLKLDHQEESSDADDSTQETE